MKKDLLRQKPENSAHPHHKFLGTKFLNGALRFQKKGFQRLKRPFLKFYQKTRLKTRLRFLVQKKIGQHF